MRVHFEHREKSVGVLRSGRQVEVIVHVEFSQEELSVIECRELREFIIMERGPNSRLAAQLAPEEAVAWEQAFHLRIGDLMAAAPDRFTLDTPSDAKAYQARLTDALQQLKSFISDNAALGRPTSLEF